MTNRSPSDGEQTDIVSLRCSIIKTLADREQARLSPPPDDCQSQSKYCQHKLLRRLLFGGSLAMCFSRNIASYSCRSYPINAFIGLNMLLVGSHLYVIYLWFIRSEPAECLQCLLALLLIILMPCNSTYSFLILRIWRQSWWLDMDTSISLMGLICRQRREDTLLHVNIGPPWLGNSYWRLDKNLSKLKRRNGNYCK